MSSHTSDGARRKALDLDASNFAFAFGMASPMFSLKSYSALSRQVLNHISNESAERVVLNKLLVELGVVFQ